MKKQRSIQIKAAFLMSVFSLNTLIGFACAIGIDMRFNTSHHDEAEEAIVAVVHIHKDGKKHVHHEAANNHNEADNDHHKKDGKDNCCNDKVIKFNEVDKSASHSLNASINPIFFTTFISSYSIANILYTSFIFI